MVYGSERTQVAWNINSELSYQICLLIKLGDSHFLRGNPANAYYAWTRIRNKIDPNISETEKKKLDILEKNCSTLIFKLNYKNTIGSREKLVHEFQTYERQIMQYLKSSGFLTDKQKKTIHF